MSFGILGSQCIMPSEDFLFESNPDIVGCYYSPDTERPLLSARDVVAIGNLGMMPGPYVLATFRDGRKGVLSAGPFFAASTAASSQEDAKVALAVSSEILGLLLSRMSSPAIGIIAEFLQLGLERYFVGQPQLPVGLLLSAALGSGDNYRGIVNKLGNGASVDSSSDGCMQRLYDALVRCLKDSDDLGVLREVTLGYRQQLGARGCRFTTACFEFVETVLQRLSLEPAAGIVPRSQRLVPPPLKALLLEVFIEAYKSSGREQEQDCHMCVLDGLLAAVRWLGQSIEKSKSPNNESEAELYLTAVHLLPPPLRVTISVACRYLLSFLKFSICTLICVSAGCLF